MRYGFGRMVLSSGIDLLGGVGKVVYVNSKCCLFCFWGVYGI